jgi:hypothetical protein
VNVQDPAAQDTAPGIEAPLADSVKRVGTVAGSTGSEKVTVTAARMLASVWPAPGTWDVTVGGTVSTRTPSELTMAERLPAASRALTHW